ncbi:MAG TPA: permease-like cell division protein FtsX [Nitrospiria bacterium]|nr:permease-like cell division protein FtsX [Nitrospiria bacterium]
MNTLIHFLKEFLYSLNQNKWLTLGAIFSSAFIWVILGFFVITYLNLFEIYSGLKEDLKIFVYLQDSISTSDQKGLENRLMEEKEVLSVNYVSKEKALLDFRKALKSKEDLFQDFDGNPLPSYFEVRLKQQFQSSEDFSGIADKFKGNRGVEDIFFGKEWVDSLNRTIRFIQLMGIGIALVLAIGVITTIGIIVRLAVYSKEEEIQILKYIGATEWFIKAPLLIEGGFLGFMSAGLSLVLLYAVFLFLNQYPPFVSLFSGTSVKAFFLPPDFVAYFLISGPLLGIIGSFFPLRKYLKTFS